MQVDETNTAYVPSVVHSYNRRRRRNPLSDAKTTSAIVSKLSSNEHKQWSKTKFQGLAAHKHPAKVTHISYSSSNLIAVAASTRISLYEASNGEPARRSALNRVNGVVYGCSFRSDSAVLAAGGEERIVRVFDMASRTVLREMKNGHSDAIHDTLFSSANAYTLFSCGDDGVVNCWDMRTKHRVVENGFSHSDKVRAIALGMNEHEVCSGGYDNLVKVWDIRKPDSPVFQADHGAQVESLTWIKRKLVSGGGDGIKIWDVENSVTECVHHFKTHKNHVTSLATASNGTRLLSGGLDQFIQVHDAESFKVVASITMPAPILALSVSQNDDTSYAVGMVDGNLHIRYRVLKEEQVSSNLAGSSKRLRIEKESDDEDDADNSDVGSLAAEDDEDGEQEGEFKDAEMDKKLDEFLKQRLEQLNKTTNVGVLYRASAFEYFHRGKKEKAESDDQIATAQKSHRNSKWDLLMRKFKHQEALDEVMRTRNIAFINALLEQLIRRNALDAALSRRDERFVVDFLHYLGKNVGEIQYSRVTAICLEKILDLYGDNESLAEHFRIALKGTRSVIKQELILHSDLFKLKGIMDLILTSAASLSCANSSQ
jgi:U3 small nucleolar RNA-associated protein 15